MGLLEEKLKGLLGYIEANTPRATRPVAKPSQVINQGLINPNKYNAPAANRFKDSAFGLLGVVPGVGDAASAAESADLFNRGEKFAGSMAALGALPLVPAIGGIFIGKGAKTWDVLKAQQAEEMLKQGIDPREVWKQTGTMKGVDGFLRQEIPDNAALFGNRRGNLDHIIAGQQSDPLSVNTINSAMVHKDLNAAYPDVMDINLNVSRKGNSHYKARTGLDPEMIDLGTVDKSPLLHELQHAIQQREGWARGGSPAGFSMNNETFQQAQQSGLVGKGYTDEQIQHELYRRLAGEAEARLTQSRMGMNMDERLASYPYDMLDIPQEQLIVRGLLDGPAMSYADEAAQKGGGLLGKVDNAGMNSDAIQKAYLDAISQDPYAVYGVRVIPHGYEVKEGDLLEHSKVWVDGEMTDEVLPGVSTIGIEKGDVAKALERLQKAGYSGKQIAIVKGDSGGYGEDAYERLIKNPEVVRAFLKGNK